MSNQLKTRNGIPFDFVDGLRIKGVDVTSLNQAFTPAGAGLIGFTPVGNLAATNVQDALDAVTGSNGAASVGYMPAGTGAVATTVQAKLRERVSVFDFMTAAQIADVQAGTALVDVTAAFQAALNSGKSLFVPAGTYRLSEKLIYSGQVSIRGEGKTLTYLEWSGASGHQGFSFTPSSWHYTIDVSNMSLVTAGNATDTALYINWKPLGSSGIPYFDRRAYLNMLRIIGTSTTTSGWLKGIECDFPFAVEVTNCEIWGKASSAALLPDDFVTDSIGVSVPNQTLRTLANFKIANTTIFGFATAALIYNVEGFTQEDCDYQVCYDGLDIRNVITKINQYRISHNHIGVSGVSFRARNCRQILFNSNEVSYRRGRTDGGTVSLLELDGVYSCTVEGNSIRGNVFNDTDVIVDGIALKWDNSLGGSDFTRKLAISGNNFQNLRYGIRNDGGVYVRYIALNGNTFDSMRQKVMDYGSANATFTEVQRIGTGNFELGDVSTNNVALQMVNIGAGLLSLDRQNDDGAAVAFRRDGSVVGTISVATTGTTYSTTSDRQLKSDLGYLSSEAAAEILRKIKIHVFKWLSNPDGAEDIGVFAQELYEVYPKAVIVGKGAPGEDNYEPWGVDYSKLVPLLIAAIG